MANVNVRAEEYKESDAFGDTPMDVLRAHAYLDLINGSPRRDPHRARRTAKRRRRCRRMGSRPTRRPTRLTDDAHTAAGTPANPDDCPCSECDGSCVTHDDADHGDSDGGEDPDDDARPEDESDGGEPGPGSGGDGGGPGSGGPGGSGGQSPRPACRRQDRRASGARPI